MNKVNIIGRTPAASGLKSSEVKEIIFEALAAFKKDRLIVEISFVSKEEIARLNREYRQIDKPTDVLSFPQAPIQAKHYSILGSIVINLETVIEKNEQIVDVIKHGMLHLLGFDHETDPKGWESAANIINCEL
jgi:probable rRNA maturation factor